MQARQMLLDGLLKANSWKSAAKLSALLAHADGVKFLPNFVVENFSLLKDVIKSRKENKVKETAEQPNKRRRVKRKSSESEKEEQTSNQPTCSSQNESVQECERLPTIGLSNYLNYIVEASEESLDPTTSEIPENFLQMIAIEHEKLSRHNMTIPSAKYWLLEEISLLKGFGEELFEGILTQNDQTNLRETIRVSVSPHGLTVTKIERKEIFK
jgi:E3 ubiquitin-protein ligase MYLIP